MQNIYQNNFGEIYTDRISLLVLNQKKTIYLQNITKIRFIKRKTFTSTYAVLFLAIILFYILKPSEKSLIGVLITFTLTVICFNFKLKQHKIIIIRKNDFIKIDVEKKSSRDAENFINHLKELHRL